ncbi:MAG: hypothetical protein ACXVAM_15710 [Vulcanimicrobiaceae bacterium]
MKFGALMGIVILTSLFVGCSHSDVSRPDSPGSALLLPSDSSYTSSEEEWLTYGHDYGNQRFSRLGEIKVGNLSHLVPAYVFQTGVVGAFETNPLVANGTMYLTTAYGGVFAIDARTGDLRWKRDPLTGSFQQCCGPVNRGAAIWKKLVIVGQLDGKGSSAGQCDGIG